MFIILEITPVTNVGLYSARNVTTSLFKSFRKTCQSVKILLDERLAHDKLHEDLFSRGQNNRVSRGFIFANQPF